ncbi:hypothetical protein [Paramaledivibacter caminithermalis]|nr:hypothetical protein [Paramaledivibacter caminithermalis]
MMKKLGLLFLTFLLVFSLSATAFAADTPVNNEVPEDEIVFTKVADGEYRATVKVESQVSATAINAAEIDFVLSRDASFDNVYNIYYNITANNYVNGIYASPVKITNTSWLNKKTYYSETLSKSFTATKTYHGEMSKRLIVDPGEDKVRLTATGLKIYFLNDGWTSAINQSTVIVLE